MHIELERWITYGEYKYRNATKYLYDRIDRLPSVNPQPKTGCEGCIYEKTGNNSTYPCSHCGRCYTDKYKAESEEQA